jgi:hypothetical protein
MCQQLQKLAKAGKLGKLGSVSWIPDTMDRIVLYEGAEITVRVHLFVNCTETFVHDHGQSFASCCLHGSYDHKLYSIDPADGKSHYVFSRRCTAFTIFFTI